ncbi:hypothetical protein CA13_10540 [Planctomycetes bacterium CA13]|uniref:Uncharacterized protein n=1 Tax=Novipirellula herctigrandis TaxID=2527986 RepID=A0A5C5YX64_9BACT|nr:hypothetical protein CA13_10540 [Planctomycetes bacterium CA13]
MTRREVLPWGVNKPWAESNRYLISELIPFTVTGPPVIHSSSLPLCVRFNRRLRGTTCDSRQLLWALILRLQHSILGVWLALTQAGFPPASQSDLASPHVYRLVIRPVWFAFPRTADVIRANLHKPKQ